jgi:hypothetical protein
MSKQNKANKNNYMQAGRLTPDDMARERMKGAKPEAAQARASVREDRGSRGATRPRSAPVK